MIGIGEITQTPEKQHLGEWYIVTNVVTHDDGMQPEMEMEEDGTLIGLRMLLKAGALSQPVISCA